MTIRRVKLTKNVHVKIVTSGYDDRFILNEVSYSAHVYTDNPLGFDCSFPDQRHVWNFLETCVGMDSDAALEAEQQAEINRYISGYITPLHWTSLSLTQVEAAAINAYLKVNDKQGRFNEDFLKSQRAFLEENPLSEDLLAIVKYQLAECDRMNTWQFGYPNGRVGAREND